MCLDCLQNHSPSRLRSIWLIYRSCLCPTSSCANVYPSKTARQRAWRQRAAYIQEGRTQVLPAVPSHGRRVVNPQRCTRPEQQEPDYDPPQSLFCFT
ncbi:hypothetical protein AX14_009025 [Amanita brunnescens Koide BX004]|nr:hypothetical protein AX14_009025 [Amanita brunnescens Koide BX004]